MWMIPFLFNYSRYKTQAVHWQYLLAIPSFKTVLHDSTSNRCVQLGFLQSLTKYTETCQLLTEQTGPLWHSSKLVQVICADETFP